MRNWQKNGDCLNKPEKCWTLFVRKEGENYSYCWLTKMNKVFIIGVSER